MFNGRIILYEYVSVLNFTDGWKHSEFIFMIRELQGWSNGKLHRSIAISIF